MKVIGGLWILIIPTTVPITRLLVPWTEYCPCFRAWAFLVIPLLHFLPLWSQREDLPAPENHQCWTPLPWFLRDKRLVPCAPSALFLWSIGILLTLGLGSSCAASWTWWWAYPFLANGLRIFLILRLDCCGRYRLCQNISLICMVLRPAPSIKLLILQPARAWH